MKKMGGRNNSNTAKTHTGGERKREREDALGNESGNSENVNLQHHAFI
jgi:hypothetical protein